MTARIGKPCKALVAVLACVGILSLGAIVFSGASSATGVRLTASKNLTADTLAPDTLAPLFIDADTVSVAKATDCWLENVFPQGSKVLFRIKVFNPTTGSPMGSNVLKSVIIGLPKGLTFPATYAHHKTDYYWTYLWSIPANYPIGVVNYTVTARADNGAVGHYVPFNVAASSLTVAKAG